MREENNFIDKLMNFAIMHITFIVECKAFLCAALERFVFLKPK